MDMSDMMKRVQGMMGQLNETQEKMKKQTATGTAGGGMVSVTLNGHFEMVDIAIEKEAMDPSDPEMLQDLILAASSDARKKISAIMQEQASSLTGGVDLSSLGINLPGMS